MIAVLFEGCLSSPLDLTCIVDNSVFSLRRFFLGFPSALPFPLNPGNIQILCPREFFPLHRQVLKVIFPERNPFLFSTFRGRLHFLSFTKVSRRPYRSLFEGTGRKMPTL